MKNQNRNLAITVLLIDLAYEYEHRSTLVMPVDNLQSEILNSKKKKNT